MRAGRSGLSTVKRPLGLEHPSAQQDRRLAQNPSSARLPPRNLPFAVPRRVGPQSLLAAFGRPKLQAPRVELIQSSLLEGVAHGFTTRSGGTSTGSFAGLNLGMAAGDDPARVSENRRRVLRAFGAAKSELCGLSLVHGDRIVEGRPSWFEIEADAAVSSDPSVVLSVSAGDCFPLLFFDPASGAAGVAHCGYRGTAKSLAGKVVLEMARRFGTDPSELRVAIGPGIRGSCYEVGADVLELFAASGFDLEKVSRPTADDHALLDLPAAIRQSLSQAGVAPENIDDCGACTHCEPDRFFSHRRDGAESGRMWALIRPQTPPTPG